MLDSRSLRRLLLLSIAGAGATTAARADENLFGYSYGAEVLPAEKNELYQWITVRSGKGEGQYEAWDFATEFELGLDNRWQLSGYLYWSRHRIEGVRALDDRHDNSFNGGSVAFKYMAISPYQKPIGVALYIEPGWHEREKISGESIAQYFLEGKLIAQAGFFEDRLILVANVSAEFETERERGESVTEKEWETELTAGLSYRVAPRWFLGVEHRWQSAWVPPGTDQEYLARFLGATVHYGGRRWWGTFSWMPQLGGWPHDDRSSRLTLGEHERVEYRLKLGIDF